MTSNHRPVALPEPRTTDAFPEDPPFLFDGKTPAPYALLSYRMPTGDQYQQGLMPQVKLRGMYETLEAAQSAASSGTLYDIDPYDTLVLTETGKWLVLKDPNSTEKMYTDPEQAAWSRDFELVQKEAREASLAQRAQRKEDGDRLSRAVEAGDMEIIDRKIKEVMDQIKEFKGVLGGFLNTKKAIMAKQKALMEDPISRDMAALKLIEAQGKGESILAAANEE